MKRMITFLLSSLLITSFLAGCGGGGSSDSQGTTRESTPEEIAQAFENKTLSGSNRSNRLFIYKTIGSSPYKSIYFYVFKADDHDIKFVDISTDGKTFGEGSYFDSGILLTDIIRDIHETLPDQIYPNDPDAAKVLWTTLKENFMGGTFVILDSFQHSKFSQILTTGNRIDINITLEVDGVEVNVADEI